ncbi:MAG: aminotransferase class V-fold PLP-dependent enzyme [Anaerolineales bacterium]
MTVEKDYFQLLGLSPLINASGTLTSLGGARLRPAAAQAMAQAGKVFVDLDELHRRAGERIASLLGVPAALVTVSASAGLVQAVAACMVGEDPYQRARLPDPVDKRRVIVQCVHRNPFERSIRLAGAELVEIGDAIETFPEDLESALDQNTAAIVHFLQADMLDASLPLDQVIKVAGRFGIPVIVDAAAELPPKHNLWDLVHRGADLVIFSGGKHIAGPQSSGLVVGHPELVQAAYLQSVPYERVVARSMKAGKETILGFLAALEDYLQEDEAARFEAWENMAALFLEELNPLPFLKVTRYQPTQPKTQPAIVPRLAVRMDSEAPLSIAELVHQLRTGVPPIVVEWNQHMLWINTHTLTIQESHLIIRRIKEILQV